MVPAEIGGQKYKKIRKSITFALQYPKIIF